MNCSTCKVAAFCGRACQKKAWKTNHKAFCSHYKRTMAYAEMQCRRIKRAFRKSFVAPGISLLQPHNFFDYTMVGTRAAMLANDPDKRPDDDIVSMNNLCRNVVQVEKDNKAFLSLLRKERRSSAIQVRGRKSMCVLDSCAMAILSRRSISKGN